MFPTIKCDAANNAAHCVPPSSPSHEYHGPNKRSSPTTSATAQPVQSALSCISSRTPYSRSWNLKKCMLLVR